MENKTKFNDVVYYLSLCLNIDISIYINRVILSVAILYSDIAHFNTSPKNEVEKENMDNFIKNVVKIYKEKTE